MRSSDPPGEPGKPAAAGTAAKAKVAVAVPIKSGPGDGAVPSILDAPPAPAISSAPVSRTVWTGEGAAPLPAAGAVALATRPSSIDTDDEPADGLASIDWVLPSVDLLEPARPSTGNAGVDHEANIRRIEEKLRHFAIPAKVVGQNSGPVVTQYEVRPDKGVKLSRIEALSDDLAMALAARSIRIEAPIPGKDLVGIEIPNTVSEVVAFRPLVEDSNMLARQPADLRPRARRVGPGDGGRPRQDAAPARSRARPARARASASTRSSPAC